jgi:hypothetical protein
MEANCEPQHRTKVNSRKAVLPWVSELAGCYQKAFGEAFPLDFHFETEFSPVSILAGRIPRTGLKIRHTL